MRLDLTLFVVALSLVASAEVVSFKDAHKIKSWDAWDDHKAKVSITNILQKEKRCVTWAKLQKLDLGLEEVGRLAVNDSPAVKSSRWSIGCETMDRDYADWEAFKALLPGLGVKRARFFSGWAKTEQEKGVYDFAWLDSQIRECAAMGVKPWVCISYGNPVWGSDFRLGMRVKQVTENPAAFAAWLRYAQALVRRYADVVDEWEIWNEPFNQPAEYAEMFYRTARAIREVQPQAKFICTAIKFPDDYRAVLERLKKENALDLGWLFAFHPYTANPDDSYQESKAEAQFSWQPALALRKLVKSYSGAFDVLQGETGCPSQLEYAHAMNSIEWTEYSQAKWNLRTTLNCAARAIPCSVFTMIDLKYTFMLQSYGMVRSNLLKEFVYRRPSYFAMHNVFSYLDDNAKPVSIETKAVAGRKLTCATFSRFGRPVRFFWFADARPSSDLAFTPVDLTDPAGFGLKREAFGNPVLVEMITGRIFRLDDLAKVPMWDAPLLVADTLAVPFVYDWKKMKPADIVDTFYEPRSRHNRMKAYPDSLGHEPWMDLPTEQFLPCVDRFGQFKWRTWPGKIASEDALKASAAEEAKDLAAHPGPADRNRYGGWAKGPQLEATGRFRTHRDAAGKWWLVDPEGRLFWSFGPVRVSASSAMTPMNGDVVKSRRGVGVAPRDCLFEDLPPEPVSGPEGLSFPTPLSRFWTTHDDLLWPFFRARGETRVFDFSSANLYRKYGQDYYAVFSDLCHRRLRSWGLNTIANSSDLRICLQDRTPYAERVECQSRSIEGSYGLWWKFRDPWDASFSEGVTASLAAHGREAHDPWCIGFFIDNEINWGRAHRELAQWTLQSPADQPAKREAVRFFRERYGEIAKLNVAWRADYADWDDLLHAVKVPGPGADADLAAFTDVICETYFRRVRETVKAFDAGLLYLGCRFAGAPSWATRAGAKHCDVISYNIYAETLDGWKLPDGVDAPVLCGEFHFGATDRGPFGTGVRQAKDQADRAAKMQAYVRSALRHPQLVGVHWHQFADQAVTGRFDGEGLQVGFTDVCDQPYPEMRRALREVGYSMYEERMQLKKGGEERK